MKIKVVAVFSVAASMPHGVQRERNWEVPSSPVYRVCETRIDPAPFEDLSMTGKRSDFRSRPFSRIPDIPEPLAIFAEDAFEPEALLAENKKNENFLMEEEYSHGQR